MKLIDVYRKVLSEKIIIENEIYSEDIMLEPTMKSISEVVKSHPNYKPKMLMRGTFEIYDNPHITSLEGSPSEIEGTFAITNSNNIESLAGAPKKVDKFECIGSNKLKKMVGCPSIVKNLTITECNNIESLDGCPEQVVFFTIMNAKIKDLSGGPRMVFEDYDCGENHELVSLKGIPRLIAGKLYLGGLPKLKSISHLWECKFSDISYDHDMDVDAKLALSIMKMHKNRGTKNYIEVIKDARAEGVEDFFK